MHLQMQNPKQYEIEKEQSSNTQKVVQQVTIIPKQQPLPNQMMSAPSTCQPAAKPRSYILKQHVRLTNSNLFFTPETFL